MPSPRPTNLQPGDRCIVDDRKGTVLAVSPDKLHVLVQFDDNGPATAHTAQHATMLYDLAPDVVGAREVREHLNVSRQRLDEYRAMPDFPAATELACGPVWDRAAIHAWHLDRTRERDGRRTRVLASYRKLGNPHRVSKSTGVPYTTVRRYLAQAGALDAPAASGKRRR
jgi:hypothetical protein